MNIPGDSDTVQLSNSRRLWEVLLLMLLFFVHAGDLPPAINEAHYLCKAKNYWDPSWCQNDLFVSSGKAHVVYYVSLGWLTQFVSLEATAWIGRVLGWLLIAWAFQRLCWLATPRPYVCLLAALVWIVGVEQADLAGEWVIGGTEAKVFAYGLVLVAMGCMLQGRWRIVWPLLGAASAWHVLVGGWSVVAAMVTYLACGQRDQWKQQLLPLFVGGAIALLGVIPGLATMQNVDAETQTQAAEIYTFQRIAHHLYPGAITARRYIGHFLLIGITCWLAYPLRKDPKMRSLIVFGGASLGIAAIGLALGLLPKYSPEIAAKLLRYYWFRLTDSIVPLVAGLCICRWAEPNFVQRGRLLTVATLAVATVIVFASMFLTRHRLPMPDSCRTSLALMTQDTDAQRMKIYEDWRAVCNWIHDNTDPDDVLLSPRHQQTFKWYTGRAEVANWKDVPQDAESLVQWNARLSEIFPKRLGGVRVTIRYDKLAEFRKVYGAKYLVVDNRWNPGNLPLLQLYPTAYDKNDSYRVYQIPFGKQ